MANISGFAKSAQRNSYEQKYNMSRSNLLLVVVFTVINLILLVTNSNSYFLFSAFIPYFITDLGMYLCGRYPEEVYVDGLEELVFLDNSVFVVLLVISIVLTLMYFLAWLFSSKNRVGWLIFALVFFGIDTVGMIVLTGLSFESAIDILFHAWVVYYLVVGIAAHSKLKNLPPEENTVISDGYPSENTELGEDTFGRSSDEITNSNIIRVADMNVKHRVLLEANILHFNICYRRVKHTNELIINGNVYDELEGVIETAHVLKAWIDGHYITAGYTGTHSVISVDGENTVKKIRWY